MSLEVTPEFRKFIKNILARAHPTKKRLKKLMSEENLRSFREAFIHWSYSQDFNYEHNEWYGDLVLNLCVGKWLKKTFPKIVNVDWLTHMKHSLVSKKTLGLLAEHEGFFEHTVYGEEYQKVFDAAKNIRDCQEYKDLLEDTFEAFLGALVEIEDRTVPLFVGERFSYNIIKSFLDAHRRRGKITLDYREYYDPISRLKEVYDKYHWSFGSSRFYDMETQRVTIWGYPMYNKEPNRRNKVILAENIYGPTKSEAQKKAAERALQVLKRKFGISWEIPDPYKKNYKRKRTLRVPC